MNGSLHQQKAVYFAWQIFQSEESYDGQAKNIKITQNPLNLFNF